MTTGARPFKSELSLEAYMRRQELGQLAQTLISAGVIHESDAVALFQSLARTCRATPVQPHVEAHRENLALAYETLAVNVV